MTAPARAVRERHPPFVAAVRADLTMALRQRGDAPPGESSFRLVADVVRLMWVSDAFGALVLYRLKAACQRRRIPIVPRAAHRAAASWAQLSIGDSVVVHPGVILPHGQVVIEGRTEIHTGARLRPFVTIGPKPGGAQGPTVCKGASIGTGAQVLGAVTVGARAQVGANAVVLDDVPPNSVVVGTPARDPRTA